MGRIQTCRIDGILATQANQAVIFRRGPSKKCQMLLWDLTRDEVTPGQWLSGRVYTNKCDVSSDGRYVVVKAMNPAESAIARNTHPLPDPSIDPISWTSISRPPYFTAIALGFNGWYWNGGGLWKSPQHLQVHRAGFTWHESIAPSSQIKITEIFHGGFDIATKKLLARGWILEDIEEASTRNKRNLAYQKISPADPDGFGKLLESVAHLYPPKKFVKPFRKGSLVYTTKVLFKQWQLCDDSGKVHRTWSSRNSHLQWIEIDAKGRVIFGENGCLWAWEAFPEGQPTLIADLNSHSFQPILAPDSAREW